MANLIEGLPPEEQVLVQNAERRRKLADALRKQSSAPQGQMVGDRYVAPSITQYLAAGLNGYQANKIDRDSDRQQEEIYTRRGETIKSANQRLAEALKSGGAPQDLIAAQAQYGADTNDPNALNNAVTGQINYSQNQQLKEEQRKFQAEQKALDIQARMDGIKEQIAARQQQGQDTREMQLTLAKMAQDGRRELAAIAQANRPEPALETIVGADGKPVFVSRRDAIGKTPVTTAKGKGLSAASQKELFDTEDAISGSKQAIKAFDQALAINDKAMGGFGAGALATAGSVLPDALRPNAIDSTQELDNILQGSALPQLKAIFGGMPTEGERAILLDVQGSSSKPASVRKGIFKRAKTAAENRIKYNSQKAKQIRDGTFFGEEGGVDINAPAADPISAEMARRGLK